LDFQTLNFEQIDSKLKNILSSKISVNLNQFINTCLQCFYLNGFDRWLLSTLHENHVGDKNIKDKLNNAKKKTFSDFWPLKGSSSKCQNAPYGCLGLMVSLTQVKAVL